VPRFEHSERFSADLSRLFDFFRRPANLLAVSPPDLQLRLLSAPDLLQLGARVVVQLRRWGLTRRVVTEVISLEEGALFVEVQREGLFPSWSRTQRFEALADGGTRLTEQIDYEPPTGLLGKMLTATLIERELKRAFDYRATKLAELLASGAASAPRETSSR
jgi:ligand-binding SRPBCC domain-containing protein